MEHQNEQADRQHEKAGLTTSWIQSLAPLLALFIGVMGLLYCAGSLTHLNTGPAYMHSWRQGDSFAQYKNYLQDEEAFLEPRVFNVQLTSKGYVASELPLTYWVAAQFAKVLGDEPYILKSIHLLILMGGLLGIYFLTKMETGDKWLSVFPPLLFASSPLVMYYGSNAMPNMPAIGLVLLSWFYFWRFLTKSDHVKDILIAAVLLTLGMTIKPSEGIHLVAMVMVFVIGQLFYKKQLASRWSNRKLGLLLGFVAVVVVGFLGWVSYVDSFNEIHGNKINLQDILPIWKADAEKRDWIWKAITVYHFKDVGSRAMWWTMLIMFVSLLLNPRSYRHLVIWPAFLLTAGAIAYVLLFYLAFEVHNYYFITTLPAFLFVSIAWLKVYYPFLVRKPMVYLSYAICIGLYVFAANFLIKQTWTKVYQLPEWDYLRASMFDFEPALRSMGVDRFTKIVSIPDPTPNVTLYYCNNPGWTDYLNQKRSAEQFKALHAIGARYLICADTNLIAQSVELQSVLGPPLGHHENIWVYPIQVEE